MKLKRLVRRRMRLERLEKRYAFSADLLSHAALQHCNHGDHDDHGGPQLHVLDVLPQPADPVNPQDTLNTSTPTALADTFRLHSLPGANHTIYLDFDGHVTTNTIWNSSIRPSITTPAFDLDGNTSSFSDAERMQIQWIWERVAEDFLPFQVNVTTEDPGAAALTKSGTGDTAWGVRLAIGGSSSDWYGPAAGGVAYVGSFNWNTDTPAFVFPAQLGGGHEKYTAEAISHEAGHTLGLAHDGRTNPVEEYYWGHGSGNTAWAPIMGASYYNNVSQWSKGEYLNSSQTQDDLSIITTSNGFGYRVDDRGSTHASANPLATVGNTIADWGIIERTTDIDVYYFTTDAGPIQIQVDPLDRGPNLDVFLQLYDSLNQLVATANPSDTLGATIAITATAQQYFLRVSGTGFGDPSSSGYSKYASLGQYFVRGSILASQNDYVSITTSVANKPEGNSSNNPFTFVVNRSGNTSASTSVNYTVAGTATNGANAADFMGGVLPSGLVTFAPGESSKTVTVYVAGDLLVEANEAFMVSLSNPAGSTSIVGSEAYGNIQNDDNPIVAGVTVTPTSGLTTRETRTTASFTVVLTSAPTANVTIPVASGDTTEGTVNTSSLTFTPVNWNVPQTVVVTGVDDTIRDGNVTYLVVLSSTQSTDPNYNGLNVADVSVTNQDNERGGRKNAAVVGGASQLDASEEASEEVLVDLAFADWVQSKASGTRAAMEPQAEPLNPNGDTASRSRVVIAAPSARSERAPSQTSPGASSAKLTARDECDDVFAMIAAGLD